MKAYLLKRMASLEDEYRRAPETGEGIVQKMMVLQRIEEVRLASQVWEKQARGEP